MRDSSSSTRLFPFFLNARRVVLLGHVVHNGSTISVCSTARTCSSLNCFVTVGRRYVYSADPEYAMLVYCVEGMTSAYTILLNELCKLNGGVWPPVAFDKMGLCSSNKGNTERFFGNATVQEMAEVCIHHRRPTQVCMFYHADR